jgi:hypothetical protein
MVIEGKGFSVHHEEGRNARLELRSTNSDTETTSEASRRAKFLLRKITKVLFLLHGIIRSCQRQRLSGDYASFVNGRMGKNRK